MGCGGWRATCYRVLARFTRSPGSGVLTGTLSTAVLQSSSATTVAAVGFVSAGLLGFDQAVGIILGANLGTTVTGWLVALLGLKLNIGEVTLPLVLARGLAAAVRSGAVAQRRRRRGTSPSWSMVRRRWAVRWSAAGSPPGSSTWKPAIGNSRRFVGSEGCPGIWRGCSTTWPIWRVEPRLQGHLVQALPPPFSLGWRLG